MQWWFTAAPPVTVREALALVLREPGERPNDQPPEDWLVAQAERRGGFLAGFAASGGPDCPRMRVDAAIVPASQAGGLADEIASLWPIDDGRTALDLAIVEGLASKETDRVLWSVPGSEVRCTLTGDSLDAAFCSFWWD